MMRTLFALIFILVCRLPAHAAEPGAPAPADIFDSARVHTIHLRIPADGWKRLPPGAATRKPSKKSASTQPTTDDIRLHDGAGARYAYVRSEIDFDGQPIADVGIRLKGNSSYAVSENSPRRLFKLSFDRFVQGQRFAGLSTINLNNAAFDASQVRETFAFALFRELGVPAPRTGNALVYLTVPGLYDHQFLGLYTLIEEIDHKFLKQNFPHAGGLLFKPGGMRGLVYYGEDWAPYVSRYAPKETASPQQARRVIEFVRLINRADDAAFRQQIKSYLNVDEFLRYLAINSAITNFDSYLSTGHNYYLYLDPSDNRFVFLPWDMNLSFGAYSWLGSPKQTASTSITHAYADHNRLIERLLAIDSYTSIYRAHMRRLIDGPFSPAAMNARFETLAPVFHAAEQAAQKAGCAASAATRPTSGLGFGQIDLRTYLAQRINSIRLQLDGSQQGYIPGFRDPTRVPPEWRPYTAAAVAMMTAADTDHDGRLNDTEAFNAVSRLLTTANLPSTATLDRATTVTAIDRLLTPDMRSRTTATAWANWLFHLADANKDRHLSAAELLAVYHQKLSGEDRDGDAMFDGRELLETLAGSRAPADTQVHP